MKKINEKDKRSLIIIIVAIISITILVISHIVIFYILPDIVFYCPDADEATTLQAGCLLKYPEKYEDKFVKVLGSYSSDSAIWTVESGLRDYTVNISGYIKGASAYFGLSAAYLPFSFVNNTNDSLLIENNQYYWYGIFRYTGHVISSGGSHMVHGMYLDVTKVENI